MPALELRDAITIITGIITLSGMVFALRSSIGELRIGQTEVLRQLAALHKRMDIYGERITRTERDRAVLTERVRNLRDTQRFKLRPEPAPMLSGEDDEG
jgi:hypothetical protein